MKAVCFHAYGDPKVLHYEEVADPLLNSDEILIRIRSSGVSPLDARIRRGEFKNIPCYPLPCILGWEICGEVVAIGAKVVLFKEGDCVVAHPSVFRRGGAYAEYTAVKENEAVVKPEGLSYMEAAAASMNGLTAWQALFDVAHLSCSQRVLIHAAAGGVGHLAVQLAKWKGAYVIGTASAKNKDFLLDLGVDEVIDYTETPFESVVQGVDVVIDTLGKDALMKSFPIVKRSGIVVSIVDSERIKEASNYGIRGEFMIVKPNAIQLAEIMKLMAERKLKAHILKTFPLRDAYKAHELLETGHVKGKIVLQV